MNIEHSKILRQGHRALKQYRRTTSDPLDLSEAILDGVDLSLCDLSFCDLSRADLRNVKSLEGADLSGTVVSGTKFDLSDVPVIPDIHKRVWEFASIPGNFRAKSFHSQDGKAHCRAGIVAILAGDAGKALEWKVGTDAAAALIYKASLPRLRRVPNWFADEEEMLRDMEKSAK